MACKWRIQNRARRLKLSSGLRTGTVLPLWSKMLRGPGTTWRESCLRFRAVKLGNGQGVNGFPAAALSGSAIMLLPRGDRRGNCCHAVLYKVGAVVPPAALHFSREAFWHRVHEDPPERGHRSCLICTRRPAIGCLEALELERSGVAPDLRRRASWMGRVSCMVAK